MRLEVLRLQLCGLSISVQRLVRLAALEHMPERQPGLFLAFFASGRRLQLSGGTQILLSVGLFRALHKRNSKIQVGLKYIGLGGQPIFDTRQSNPAVVFQGMVNESQIKPGLIVVVDRPR